MERQTPTVIYRSVSGSRVPPQFHGGDSHHVSPFALEHQEIFPFPAESNIWRLEAANASRVFEVWGSAGSAVVGRGEALLGLAKIPLRPFEGFTETERGMGAANDGTNGSLAVAADGPVAIVDPFSGKAVGELHFFFALGTSPTISALAALGAESGDVAEVAGSDIGGTLDHLSTAVHRETPREEGKKEEATGEELEGGGRSEMGGVLQGGDKRAGEDGLSFFFVHEEPVALDDSVVGEKKRRCVAVPIYDGDGNIGFDPFSLAVEKILSENLRYVDRARHYNRIAYISKDNKPIYWRHICRLY